jgi:hypothetical protein
MGCAAGWLGMRWPGAAGAALGCCAGASPAKGAAAAGAKLRRSTAAAVGGSARQKPARGHRLLQLPRKRGCSTKASRSKHHGMKERPSQPSAGSAVQAILEPVSHQTLQPSKNPGEKIT